MIFYRQDNINFNFRKKDDPNHRDTIEDPDYRRLQESKEWKAYREEPRYDVKEYSFGIKEYEKHESRDVEWRRVSADGILQEIHYMGCYEPDKDEKFKKLVELLKSVNPMHIGGNRFDGWHLDFKVTVDEKDVVWLYEYSQTWADLPCRQLCKLAFGKIGIEFEGDYDGGVYLNSRVAAIYDCFVTTGFPGNEKIHILDLFPDSFNDAVLRWNAIENLGDHLVKSLTLTGLTLVTELLPAFLESENERLED